MRNAVAGASLCHQPKRKKALPFDVLQRLVEDFILYGIQGESWDGQEEVFAGANNFGAIRSVAFIERNRGRAFGLIGWELKEVEDGDGEDSFTLFYCSASGAEMGRLKYNGPAYRFEKTPSALRFAAPRLGEHTEAVMTRILGFDQADIARFRDKGLLQ